VGGPCGLLMMTNWALVFVNPCFHLGKYTRERLLIYNSICMPYGGCMA
jgi:hypothetical protein